MQLTYQWANLIGDGCGSRRARYSGLTDFGVLVVERMNKVGMLIDLSHCGYKTTLDTVEMSKDPVAFTHTNVKAINDMLRCKDDEELKAVAETEGVIGITGVARFIRKEAPREGATIEHFLDHIDYVVDLVGSDHVGIGLDMGEGKTEEMFFGVHKHLYNAKKTNKFWGWTTAAIWIPTGEDWSLKHYYPFGLDSYSKIPNITKGLVARGYSDQEIIKILGQNWLRLFKRVWRE